MQFYIKLKYLLLFVLLALPDYAGSQSRFEFDISISYASPRYEAYGTVMTISPAKDVIFIDGKRLLISDNFGTEDGYSVQVFAKYYLMKSGLIKGILNIGYTRLLSLHEDPGTTEFGMKLQSFSVGIGSEITPFTKFILKPSIFGLLRMNFVGGETFHVTGIDFFKVTSRFGYSAGLKLGYTLSNYVDLFGIYSYNYDNLWNKETNEENTPDTYGRTIVFRDKASNTNGLTHDRRFGYASFGVGMSLRLK